MKIPYESPRAERILFRAIERLATEPDPEVGGDEVDLGGNEFPISGNVDWEWPEN